MTRTVFFLSIAGAIGLALVSPRVAAQQPRPAGGLEVLPVADNVYLFAGTGANIVVQAAEEGAW